MAIGVGWKLKVDVRYRWANQKMQNVWWFRVDELPAPATALEIAEGLWAQIGPDYRALAPSTSTDVFESVVVNEYEPADGELAEYPIPPSEQAGTRSAAGLGDALPVFNAAGVRMVVTTRATRPGQKRFPFLYEADNVSGVLQAGYQALVENLLDQFLPFCLLGDPALNVKLVPQVVRLAANGVIVAGQDITGYYVNPQITTQNSRKIGRGT